MRILHLALADDWESARAFGEYQVSSRGTSVDDAGFLHAATARQLPRVAEHAYADVREPLLVLVIDLGELAAAGIGVRWEPASTASGGPFPHILGPLPTDEDTVVAALPAHFEGRRFVLPDLGGLDVMEDPPATL